MQKESAMHTFDRGAESGAVLSIHEPLILLDVLARKIEPHFRFASQWGEAEPVSREPVLREVASRLRADVRDEVPLLVRRLRTMREDWLSEVRRQGLSVQEARDSFDSAGSALCALVTRLNRTVDLNGDDCRKVLKDTQDTFRRI